MNVVQLITKKRDGGRIPAADIRQLIAAYTRGDVPDYQMSAWAMAVFLRGMHGEETAALTEAMLESGTRLRWPAEFVVGDKHSTGGIGDKTSLILAPLLACCGAAVPMISGRGLGATGGTLDKLEALPGFRTDLSLTEIRRQTEQIGCTITGATTDLAPADRKLYALRDVTATVASIPLITASIMSKKLAEGLKALVLDVKCGSGAFMRSAAEARLLAESLVAVGRRMNVRTTALISDMNQPLGRMVGNAVEVDEALEVLRSGGPADLVELTLELGAEVLVSCELAATRKDAVALERKHLASGAAYEKFAAMVRAQGGDLDAPRPRASEMIVVADRRGYITRIDAEALGWTIIELGGGRKQLGDPIDHAVGLELMARLGDEVRAGDPLARVWGRTNADREAAGAAIREAVQIGETGSMGPPLVLERIA